MNKKQAPIRPAALFRNAFALAAVAAAVSATTMVPHPAASLAVAAPAAPVHGSAVLPVVAAVRAPRASDDAPPPDSEDGPEAEPVMQDALLRTPAAEDVAEPMPVSLTDRIPVLADLKKLRAHLHWVRVEVDGRAFATPDADSRLLLARSAAAQAGLDQVGLDFRDVYGLINAETSWVPRAGMGKDGIVSRGLAQFEPATARAVGLRNPDDPVEAVLAAARHLREAARWSADRIAALKLSPEERAVKLREGVSIYYNLSSRARSAWSGLNTQQLPVETLRHIHNLLDGVHQAEQLVGGAKLPLPAIPAPPPVVTARAEAPAHAQTRHAVARSSAPRTMGSIAWSRADGEHGRREYAVYADGSVSRHVPAHGRGNYITWTRRAG